MDEQVVIWSLVVVTAAAIGSTILCCLVWPLACWAAGLAVQAACAPHHGAAPALGAPMSGLLTPEPARGRWVREPTAIYTCRHGCAHTAAGALDVARFTEAIDAHHARHCPGRDRKGRTA